MAARLFVIPFPTAFNSNGLAVPGATASFYEPGGLTPKIVHSDSALSVSIGSSVTANGAGRWPLFYLDSDATYRIRIFDADGNLLDDVDNYVPGEIVAGETGPQGPTGTISNTNFLYLNLNNDLTTDNYSTIQTAIDSLANTGGEIALPSGRFRVSQRLKLPRTIYLHGVGSGTRSYVYGETTSPNGWDAYTGTVLVFDVNQGGIYCPIHTDVTDTNTVVANRGASGSNPTYWQYGGARGTRVEGMVLYSKGYTGTPDGTHHGIEARDIVNLRDLIIYGFPGHGVYLTASADVTDGASKYGLVDQSTLRNVFATTNLVCGFRTEGRDANVIEFTSCNAAINGSWGFDDNGFLGNTYINCHTTVNNQNALIADHGDVRYTSFKASATQSVGSFRATNIAAPHVYLGCYVETGNGSGTTLTTLCLVIGGLMSGTANSDTTVQPVSFFGNLLQKACLQHYNPNSTVAVSSRIGSPDTRASVFGFGSVDAQPGLQQGTMGTELFYYPSPNYTWSLEQPNANSQSMIAFPNALTDAYPTPFFQNGFSFGSPIVGINRRVSYTTGTTAPNGIYQVNDIIYIDAAPSGNIGLVCTTGGTKASAWASGQTYSPNGWRNLASCVSNASKVYRCVTQGGGTTSVAPTHGAGTVTGADGYAWRYLNADTVPVFKTFGAIAA